MDGSIHRKVEAQNLRKTADRNLHEGSQDLHPGLKRVTPKMGSFFNQISRDSGMKQYVPRESPILASSLALMFAWSGEASKCFPKATQLRKVCGFHGTAYLRRDLQMVMARNRD